MAKEIKLWIFLLIIGLHAGIAQNIGISWKMANRQEKKWYASVEAQRIADNVLLYQHENGGWYKNIDMADKLNSREKDSLKKLKMMSVGTTIDNGATYSQLNYLAKVYTATGKQEYGRAFMKGLFYLLEAQYEDGGWPQFYPVREGYYEHITFNDGAMIGVMELLRNISRKNEPYKFVSASGRKKAKKAIEKGLRVILATQVNVDGKLTIWCAQHNKDDYTPAKARAYELPSLSGKESVGIVEYLLRLENPSEEVKLSIRSAVEWFEEHKVTGKKVVLIKDTSYVDGYDRVVIEDTLASPLWGRFNDLNTGTPIFVGRDGKIKQHLADIEQERRMGYNYIDNYAEKLLKKEYPEWEKRN